MAGGGDTFRTVKTGEPLAIPAAAWNALMDSARKNATPEVGFNRDSQSGPVEVSVRNDSGADLPRFGVLSIDAPLISPADNEGEFLGRVAFSGVAITALNAHSFVMALEPILDGKIGRATLSGTNTCTVTVGDTRHQFARALAGSNVLITASSGPVRLLWVESSTGSDKRAVVQIDHSNDSVLAIITSATPNGTNAWSYSWSEADINDGDFTAIVGGKSSSTYGSAFNLNEAPNSGSGVQGNGIDVANLNGFEIQPIGVGAVVELHGPHKYTDLSNNWFFSAVNTVDGECAS